MYWCPCVYVVDSSSYSIYSLHVRPSSPPEHAPPALPPPLEPRGQRHSCGHHGAGSAHLHVTGDGPGEVRRRGEKDGGTGEEAVRPLGAGGQREGLRGETGVLHRGGSWQERMNHLLVVVM